jgi:hypothetical protein
MSEGTGATEDSVSALANAMSTSRSCHLILHSQLLCSSIIFAQESIAGSSVGNTDTGSSTSEDERKWKMYAELSFYGAHNHVEIKLSMDEIDGRRLVV